MNGLITPARLRQIIDVPIAFASTELHRLRAIQVAQVPVVQGQRIVLRSLTLQINRTLTANVQPVLINSSLQQVSMGLYFGSMLTAPLAYAALSTVGSVSVNPFAQRVCVSPGIYTVIVSNNTTNADFSVTATGVLKYYV